MNFPACALDKLGPSYTNPKAFLGSLALFANKNSKEKLLAYQESDELNSLAQIHSPQAKGHAFLCTLET